MSCPPGGGVLEDTGASREGGGYGKWSRLHGFVCDNLVGVEMVDTSGNVVTANKTYNADLLWGCCGGGGNNFGVVTTFILQVPPSRVTARPACGEHSLPCCMGSRRQVIVWLAQKLDRKWRMGMMPRGQVELSRP